MTKEKAIKIFENKKIRTHWDDKQEKWYFSVIDVIEIFSRAGFLAEASGKPISTPALNYYKDL